MVVICLILGGQRQGQAGKYAATPDHDGACPALAVIAALFGARKTHMLPQRIQQGGTCIDVERFSCPVDLKRHVDRQAGVRCSRGTFRSPCGFRH